MSYQVLARKWRPQSFQQVIGQAHVLTALENALAQNRVHHAYLFSGTRGVGKTTIARLLAKSLNCEQGVTATPCGQCVHCQAIDQGRFVDLLEIDAASRTKVDDTRELLDNVQYKPAQGRYKVYLIDEVHMLSKHSFNALLKTLEEPPEYVKFLLATTDPQKLPITVLSRCLQFHLKAILPEQIEQQLMSILQHEGNYYEQAALKVIAKAADGSMRDALSLTDQALAFGAGRIEYEPVLKMLGTIDQSHLYYLLHFIASGNSSKVFAKIAEFVQLGADFSALHHDLANLCHEIALKQLQVNANITDKTPEQLLAERLTPEEVQLFYQIALQGYKDYSYAPNGKVAFEMTVMRLLAFKPANYIELDEALLQSNTASAITESTVDSTAKTSISPADNTVVNSTQGMVSKVNHQPEVGQITQHAQAEIAEQAIIEHPQQPPQQLQPAQPVDVPSLETSAVSVHAVEQPFTQSLPEQKESLETVQAVQKTSAQEVNEAIQQPPLTESNSRNMLRSHRLKREALKKEQAAPESITEQQTQAAATIVEPTAVVEEKTVNAVKQQITKTEPQQTVSAGELATASDEGQFQQELPPLDSYQEQEYYNQPTGYHDQPEPISTQSEDTQAVSQHVAGAQSQQADVNHVYSQQTSETAEATAVGNSNTMTAQATQSKPVTDGQTTAFSQDNSELIDQVEIDIAAYVDDKINDTWFLAIKAMQLVGLEKLLAKHALMLQNENSITLKIDPVQQHLLNNQSLCDAVITKMQAYYGVNYQVLFEVCSEPQSGTPVALEKLVYQQYLDRAKLSLQQDPLVNILLQDYSAKLYENSVVPL